MKVLVTGGCGFIGSHIVDCLMQKEYKVYIIDNLSLGKDHWENKDKKPVLFVQDIQDFISCEKIFKDVMPDIVMHLAAHHYIPFCEKNIYETYKLNILGTLNTLELSKRFSVKKFFFASTGDVYAPSFSPHHEDDIANPIYVYGHAKYLAEQVVIKYVESKQKAMHVIIGRLFNAAGPRETNPHLIPQVVWQIIEGKRVIEVGNLWPKRDFVDVKSMADIIVDLVMKADGIEIVNIGSGQVQEVGKVLNTLVSVLPFKVDIISVPERQRTNDRPYLCPDVSKLKKILGKTANPFDKNTAKKIFSEYKIA